MGKFDLKLFKYENIDDTEIVNLILSFVNKDKPYNIDIPLDIKLLLRLLIYFCYFILYLLYISIFCMTVTYRRSSPIKYSFLYGIILQP